MPTVQVRPETEKYSTLYGTLSHWRTESSGRNGYDGILPFVSGLRFSVQLLYIIKDMLKNAIGVDAAWGHIVDNNCKEIEYSNECDIIIYKQSVDCVATEWNGRTDVRYKAMDFRFVKSDAVIAVISCKLRVQPSTVDKKYPGQLKKFTSNVWLFAEYCSFNTTNKIKTAAKKAGYKDFWALYEWDESKKPKIDKAVWESFDKKLVSLLNKHAINKKKKTVRRK